MCCACHGSAVTLLTMWIVCDSTYRRPQFPFRDPFYWNKYHSKPRSCADVDLIKVSLIGMGGG